MVVRPNLGRACEQRGHVGLLADAGEGHLLRDVHNTARLAPQGLEVPVVVQQALVVALVQKVFPWPLRAIGGGRRQVLGQAHRVPDLLERFGRCPEEGVGREDALPEEHRLE
eukprot:251079-Alexandrium_andersonii.AAC.1